MDAVVACVVVCGVAQKRRWAEKNKTKTGAAAALYEDETKDSGRLNQVLLGGGLGIQTKKNGEHKFDMEMGVPCCVYLSWPCCRPKWRRPNMPWTCRLYF